MTLQNKHAVISLLARTQVYSVCLHLEQIFEAVLEEMKLVLQLYVYVKLSKNQSWVNLLFSVSRDSIHDSFLDSSFSISNRVENRDLQWTVNLLLKRTVHEVLREVHAIKFIFIVTCINDKLIIFISG